MKDLFCKSWSPSQISFTENKSERFSWFLIRKVILKVQILQTLRRLLIILEGLTMTWFSEKCLSNYHYPLRYPQLSYFCSNAILKWVQKKFELSYFPPSYTIFSPQLRYFPLFSPQLHYFFPQVTLFLPFSPQLNSVASKIAQDIYYKKQPPS